ncbi:hypothetical protein PHSY_004930 [Pseudozyma hubeiensis SY62]|uniref:Uncharacterized protein n=1 Tax=Pseudozyma hubeiensis (strain SY62) TaxID=1305764 RepID=R9PH00_PSEHS|nr:hypothetical protein PHSY_004930 [Pseudozyma hubeiensis SY62]GAC97345.1 hypothetical protein PHSY_004930 [Pseudozyma hubeiensis SY62]
MRPRGGAKFNRLSPSRSRFDCTHICNRFTEIDRPSVPGPSGPVMTSCQQLARLSNSAHEREFASVIGLDRTSAKISRIVVIARSRIAQPRILHIGVASPDVPKSADNPRRLRRDHVDRSEISQIVETGT